MLTYVQEQVIKKLKWAGLTRLPILCYLDVYQIDIGDAGDIIIPINNDSVPAHPTPSNPIPSD